MDTKKVWEECLLSLKQIIPQTKINVWIYSLKVQFEENKVILVAPNNVYFKHVESEFLPSIQELINSISKKNTLVSLCLEENVKNTLEKKHTGVKKNYSFNNLVIGKSNQLAVEVALKITESPFESEYNPFFIYGSSGLGKTHLMHAIANKLIKNFKGMRVTYIESENFVKGFINALKNRKIDQFSEYYQSLDVLLIDDIHFFAHKEGSQQELFYTFNSLFNNKSQIILSADQFPREINGLENRLKTRFGAGLTISIEPPEIEMRVEIIKEKARQKKIKITEDAVLLIAKSIQSSVRELEGVVNRLQVYQKIKKELVDIFYVKKTIGDLLSSYNNTITVDKIQQIVSQYFQVSLKDLLSTNRSKKITKSRQIAMYLCRELTNKSLFEISDKFGKKNHTTVMHACKKIEEAKKNNEDFIHEHIIKINRILE